MANDDFRVIRGIRLPLIALAATLFLLGCYHSLDVSKVVCQVGDPSSCPDGFQCWLGQCCKAGDLACGSADAGGESGLQNTIDSASEETYASPSWQAVDSSDSIAIERDSDHPADGGITGTDAPIDGWITGSVDSSVLDAAPAPADVPIVQADGKTGFNAEDAPISGVGGASGMISTGGMIGTGGVQLTGGVGAGGIGGSGGAGTTEPGTGGLSTGGVATGGIASGGIIGTGGTGMGGAVGSGGTMAACQNNATKCASAGLQTCSNGQWGTAVSCGARQNCPDGSDHCTCDVDPICTTVGDICDGTSKLASCVQDANGCFYQASSLVCSNGACSGSAGASSCCTNTCTTGPTACVSSTSLQTCAKVASGCLDTTVVTCGIGLVCERYAPADCVDPHWAEWPMPNYTSDVTAGAPNLASFSDNGDGTVTDSLTKLVWQRVVTSDTYSWDQAVAHCSALPLGSHSDWRLPSAIELVTTWDLDQNNASVDPTLLPLTSPVGSYWSSSPAPTTSYPSKKATVFFGGGPFGWEDPSATHYVRCVR